MKKKIVEKNKTRSGKKRHEQSEWELYAGPGNTISMVDDDDTWKPSSEWLRAGVFLKWSCRCWFTIHQLGIIWVKQLASVHVWQRIVWMMIGNRYMARVFAVVLAYTCRMYIYNTRIYVCFRVPDLSILLRANTHTHTHSLRARIGKEWQRQQQQQQQQHSNWLLETCPCRLYVCLVMCCVGCWRISVCDTDSRHSSLPTRL